MAIEPRLNPLIERIIPKIIGLIWLVPTLVVTIWSIIKHGPRAAFHTKKRNQHPACLDDPTLGIHGFIKLDTGIKIHYVAKGDTGKPLMLFLHGFPEFWFSWRYQIRKFSESFRTVAIDMRGYGESDKPKGVENYAMEHLVEDVRLTVLGLGYESCVLVSHDWGGAVASSFAAEYPNMVDRLVLCNIPHSKAFMKCMQSSLKQFRMSWYMFLYQLPWFADYFLIPLFDYKVVGTIFKQKPTGSKAACNDEEVEAYKYNVSRNGALTAMINYYRATFLYKPMKSTVSTSLTMPSLIIWGTQDFALSTEMADLSKPYINDLTIKYIQTAGHWVQMNEPDLVNQHIEEFLQERADT